MPERWAGVDVGARKGFDMAVVDEKSVVAGPMRIEDPRDVRLSLLRLRPRVVAVDSPRRPAPAGELSRRCERELVAAGVCGIRYTPNEAALRANQGYYGWILNGFRLYAALDEAAGEGAWKVIECFPTATWSRFGGRKARGRSRARWSRGVLQRLAIADLPPRMNQDARDAIGAALTAKLYDRGETESFGEIVVPRTAQSLGCELLADSDDNSHRDR